MREKISSIILDHRKKLIFFVGLFVLSILNGLTYLSPNYHMRYWLNIDDPLIKRLNYFEQNFGNDESVVIGLYNSEGVLKPDVLSLVKTISEQMLDINEVIGIKSILNVEIPYWNEEKNKFEAVTVIDDDYNIDKAKALIKDSIFIDKFLLSEDHKMLLIIAELKPTILDSGSVFDEIDYINLTNKLREIKHKYQTANGQIHISGTPILQNDFGEISKKDLEIVMPLLIGFISIVLYILFRSIFLVIGAIVITSLVNTVSMAIAGYLGYQIENLLSIVPMIVITISLADMIHIFQSYKQNLCIKNKFDSIKIAIHKNFTPTFLTSFTTAIGFISLYGSHLVPVSNMGLLSAMAIMLAWGFSIILFPIVLSYLREPKHIIENTKIQNYLDGYMNFIRQNTIQIIALFTILAVSLGILGTKNTVNTDPLKFFNKNTEVRKSAEFILEHFGSVVGPELIVYANEREGILRPSFLTKVEKFEAWLRQRPYIRKTLSITELGKEINRKVHGNNSMYSKIPDTKEQIVDLYFDHKDKFKNSLSLSSRVSKDFDAIRLSLFWDVTDTRGSLTRLDEILAYAKSIGLDAEVTGKNALYLEMNDYVVGTFFSSIIMAIIAVSIIMIYLFKSVKVGLISLLPNLIPLCFITGIMTLSGISIDIGTALVCSVCLGIAIDDTIHFFMNYHLAQGSAFDRVRFVISKIGTALVVTSIILSCGFGLFMLSDFVPNYKFGFLCACTIIFALIADLVLLPALLIQLEKKSQKSNVKA